MSEQEIYERLNEVFRNVFDDDDIEVKEILKLVTGNKTLANLPKLIFINVRNFLLIYKVFFLARLSSKNKSS